ncbi:MAG: CDP-alcohol phosphatidyltransferase family protein [Coriobacteriales bacterium]|nr:CDP-alcohol phosphatidyltransferase family protein [Coriobacteriales bacterium]
MKQEVTNKVFTVANLLSFLRLLLLPVFFVLFVVYRQDLLAFIVLLVAALTDLFDGHIARATHTVSRLGQLLDPFVDRVFIVIAVIAVFLADRLPLWLLLVLLGRDVVMLGLTIYQKYRFNHNFKVVFLGKVATVFMMSGFCSLVLWWPILPGADILELDALPGWGAEQAPLGFWLLYVGVVISWITVGIYCYKGSRPAPFSADSSSEDSSSLAPSPSDLPPATQASAQAASDDTPPAAFEERR